MTTTVEWIKKLREETGAGVMDCRKAFLDAEESYPQALAALREQAEAEAAKRADREASQGRVEIYSHGDGRIGVMVEINTETDFAARSAVLRAFAHEIALQIAAAAPGYARDEDIPAEVLQAEAEKAAAWARAEGKPERIVPRIVEGVLNKFKDQQVLLRQASIRDEQVTVAQLLSQAAASVGENVVIRRFIRWELSEEL